MNEKLRVSYTLLNLWERGDMDELIAFYFKTGQGRDTTAMAEGRRYDNEIEEHIKKHNCLPDYLKGTPLIKPVTQHKVVADWDADTQIVIVADAWDEGDKTIWEFKTGASMTSSDYANTLQIPLYFGVLDILGCDPQRAIIAHYDQYHRTHDRTIIYSSDYVFTRFEDAMYKTVPQIREYFIEQGLL